jgi:hypothetical protein
MVLSSMTYQAYSAERVYKIEKQKVNGDGTGLYNRINQGTWQEFKKEYKVTLSCTDPGPNRCVIQFWPPILSENEDVSDLILNDFINFIKEEDLKHDHGQHVVTSYKKQYEFETGSVMMYFKSTATSTTKVVYELYRL